MGSDEAEQTRPGLYLNTEKTVLPQERVERSPGVGREVLSGHFTPGFWTPH